MSTWARIILLALGIADLVLRTATKNKEITKAEEDAIARVSLEILKRTRYAQQIDETVMHMSDADVAGRVRSILRT